GASSSRLPPPEAASSRGLLIPPLSSLVPARLRPLWRPPRARRGSRSRDRDPASTRAPGACARAVRAGFPPAAERLLLSDGFPRSRHFSLARDSSQNPIHEPTGLLRRVPLRECDSFVDRHLERDAPLLELVGCEAEDVPLDGS